jgi:uncharacterized protein YecE (DUF72 family)
MDQHTAVSPRSSASPRSATFSIGTSGWSYKHWDNGIFYPPRLPAAQHLPFYAEQFSTVEINYSYYHLPPRSTFEAWQQRSPLDFLFAVKGSRYLTHLKRLKEPQEPLARLIERSAPCCSSSRVSGPWTWSV